MFTPHDSCDCPPDETKIWRYMDLAKFLWILETKSLFFARTDKLGDPYEYATPKPSQERWASMMLAIQRRAISLLTQW